MLLTLASFTQLNAFEICPRPVACSFLSLHVSVVYPFGEMVFHCMGLPQFAYQFTSWWAFGLFSIWGYYKEVSTNIPIQVFSWIQVFVSLG